MKDYVGPKAILEAMGERIKQYRIARGMTQQDLELKSGVSSRSIVRLEQGNSVQLESLIKVMAALELAQNFDLLVPDQRKRPSYYLDNADKPKRRYRKKANKETTESEFKWGDEQ